jgi:hypothetical protein
MESVKKFVGWLLAIMAAMFLYAACDSGMFDDLKQKVQDKAPSVKIDK